MIDNSLRHFETFVAHIVYEYPLDKHDVKSSIPIYHNYSQISLHCSRNVLSMVAIDASNYILQTLPFEK